MDDGKSIQDSWLKLDEESPSDYRSEKGITPDNEEGAQEHNSESDEEPSSEPGPKKAPPRAHRPVPVNPNTLGRLDLRVGKVIHIEDHVTKPNIFYFEYIEAHDRVSNLMVKGLKKYYKADDIEGRQVVLLYIALPFWWNCQESQLLSVLTARSPGKVELLRPPFGCFAGEKIIVQNLINSGPRPIKPTFPFYKSTKKLLKMITPDFRVNSEKIAEYKGVPLEVEGKGFITAKTLANCFVR